jgi:hydroxyethylthiazole kinase-like uncharacterized protein yjeF
MRIVCQQEMKDIEEKSFKEFHFNETLIVENVGKEGARFIQEKLIKTNPDADIIFLIGKGNNGADGMSMARHLTVFGHSPRALCLFSEAELSRELQNQLKMAKAFGVRVYFIKELDQLISFFEQSPGKLVVVDAIFGTGVRLPLSNFLYDIINYINENSSFTIAIDIPTGVSGDTGIVQGNAIRADVTLAVGLPKLGYYVASGAQLVGQIEIINVGFPQKAIENGDKFLLTKKAVGDLLNKQNSFADKKIFGHTLVIGGSHGLTGALVLSSESALKIGAGLVTGATWEPQYQEFISRLRPEVMTGYVPLDVAKWPRLIADLEKYDSIVIGPGLARSSRARRLVLEVLNNFSGPVVLDADAINVLNIKDDKDVFSIRNSPTVMTPHFGEFSRFTGIPMEQLHERPVHFLKELVEQINCSVILKGPCTYLGFPNGKVYFNFHPNEGMATGGTGDVLAGIIGGLLGQDKKLKLEKSLYNRYEQLNKIVCFGVLLHTHAGLEAAKKIGVNPMTASSIIDNLAAAFNILEGQENGN